MTGSWTTTVEPPARRSGVDRTRVLVVDNNPPDARLVREMLARSTSPAFAVEFAATQREALERVSQEPPDVILLELGLSDSQGVGGVEQVYAAVPGVPIVVLTGLGDERVGRLAVQKGAQDFLVKDELDAKLLGRTLVYAIERHGLHECIARSEAFHRTVADHISDVITRHTPEGTLTYVSPAGERLTGIASDELIGLRFEEMVRRLRSVEPDLRTRETLLTAVKEGRTERAIVPMRRADGSEAWLETSVNPVIDPATGQVTELIGVSRDITDRVEIQRLLEERNADLRARADFAELQHRAAVAVGSAADVQAALAALAEAVQPVASAERVALGALNGEHTVRVAGAWGPAAGRLPAGATYEVDREFLSPLEEGHALLREDTHEKRTSERADRVFSEIGIRSYVIVPIVFVEGKLRAILSFSALRPHAFPPEVVPILESIARFSAGSFTTLYLLDQEREAARRLRELDQLKNDFIGIVAHDLRTPMSFIQFAAETLIRHPHRIDEDERGRLLNEVVANVRAMSTLVTNTLDVALIESGNFSVENEPFDLAQLAETIASQLGSVCGRRCVVDAPDTLPPACGDRERQRQILSNLVFNAIRFSPEEEPIEISVRVADEMLEVSVRDHGEGIDPEKLPRLFQKFSRVRDKDAPRVPGTGLGLYICKSLVEAQGGKIRVESRRGEGTTFNYGVPVASGVLAPRSRRA